jgi:hypothetical protein
LAVLTALAIDGADVDDAAELALAHIAPHSVHHVKTRAQVAVDDSVPIGAAHFHDGGVAGNACIVNQNVDWPEVSFDLGDARLARIIVGNVELVGGDASLFSELGGGGIVACIAGSYINAGLLQCFTNGTADAAGASGNDGDVLHAEYSLASFGWRTNAGPRPRRRQGDLTLPQFGATFSCVELICCDTARVSQLRNAT